MQPVEQEKVDESFTRNESGHRPLDGGDIERDAGLGNSMTDDAREYLPHVVSSIGTLTLPLSEFSQTELEQQADDPSNTTMTSRTTTTTKSMETTTEAHGLQKVKPFLHQHVKADHLFLPLLVVTLTTGLLDASTYSSYKVFASNQTGNAIILTLAAAEHQDILLRNTGASLGAFLGCALLAGVIGNWLGPRSRGYILYSNILQVILLTIITILTTPSLDVLPPSEPSRHWVALLLLASAAGFQVAMAKTSGVREVPTAMLTSPFVELATDPNLWKKWGHRYEEVRARNRRASYIISLLLGSLM